MIEILVKAWNNEKCEMLEQIYKVETLDEYFTGVKPNLLKVFAIYENMELVAEYIKISK